MKIKSALLGAGAIVTVAGGLVFALAAPNAGNAPVPLPSITTSTAAPTQLVAYTYEEAISLCGSEFAHDQAERSNCEQAARHSWGVSEGTVPSSTRS